MTVRHVWTVVCEKTVVDRQTNNVSMDVLEQLNLSAASLQQQEEGNLVAHPIVVASYWYRANVDTAARGNARVSVRDPHDKELGAVDIDVDLTKLVRLRTFCRMGGLPVSGPGYYFFVTEMQNGEGQWEEVARVPLQIVVREEPPHPH